jgi:hypothetical protein
VVIFQQKKVFLQTNQQSLNFSKLLVAANQFIADYIIFLGLYEKYTGILFLFVL